MAVRTRAHVNWPRDALSLSVTDTPTARQSEGVSPRRLRDSGLPSKRHWLRQCEAGVGVSIVLQSPFRARRAEKYASGRGHVGPVSSSGGSATMTVRTQPDAGRPHHVPGRSAGRSQIASRARAGGGPALPCHATTKLTERCLTATAASRSSHVLRRRSLPRPGSGSAARAGRESPGLLPRPAEAAPARVRHCRALA
jgi:hypothetical protein